MDTAPYRRTRLDWQAYLFIGYYSYLLNALGPLTPFLRDELHLSYTVASLHFSAYAVGTILMTGLFITPVLKWVGNYWAVWGGAAGMGLGVLLLVTGRSPWMTIPGGFLMGFLGVSLLAVFQGALAEQHGEQRAIALSESSGFASLLSAIAPAAVGFFARTDFTWRAALVSGVALLIVMWAIFGRDKVQTEPAYPAYTDSRAGSYPLSFTFWIYWAAVLIAVAIEFCTIFWGADFLEKVALLKRADAALAMSFFMGAMLVGRVFYSWFVRNVPASKLVFGAFGLTSAGFLLYWLSPVLFPDGRAAAAETGLVVAGLGISGLFPMLASLGLGNCGGQAVRASARFNLAAGIAILALPLLLGWLADLEGIQLAYGLVVVLITLGISLTLWAQRRAPLRYPAAEGSP